MTNIINITNMAETEVLALMIRLYAETKGDFRIQLSNGDIAHIEAENYTENHEDCDWFFAYCPDNVFDGFSLAEIAHDLTHYVDYLEQAETESKLFAEELRNELENEIDDEYYDEFDY